MEKDQYFRTFSWQGYVPWQVCEKIIQIKTSAGQTVFDPFSGRGQFPMEAALAGRKAIGTEISSFASAWSKVLLQRNHSGSDAARLVASGFEEQSRKTRSFLYGTLCPECSEEAYAQAVLYRDSKPVELKTTCDHCGFAGMKDFTEFDLTKEEELKKLELPIPGLEISGNVASMFNIRAVQALRILALQVLKLSTPFLVPSFKLALAYTAAQCADLEGKNEKGREFLFLNPFDFFKVNLLSLIQSAESIERLDRSEISIYHDSAFAALSRHNFRFDTVICAPPSPAPHARAYVDVVETFMNLGLLTGGDKRIIKPDTDEFAVQGEIVFPDNIALKSESLKKCVWLFADLKKRVGSGKKINLVLPGAPDSLSAAFYREAAATAGHRDMEAQTFEQKVTGGVDYFTAAPKKTGLAESGSGSPDDLWTLLSF
jgi:hypothetical protein